MRVRELIQDKLKDPSFAADLDTVMRNVGASNVRVLNPDAHLESHLTSTIELICAFEKGRTLLDLVTLEGDLQLLLGYRVNVQTVGSPSALTLGEVIQNSVLLHG